MKKKCFLVVEWMRSDIILNIFGRKGFFEAMTKAVIFDLDGLLIDSEVISFKLIKELLGEYGVTCTLEDYAQKYSGKTAARNIANMIEEYSLPWDLQTGLDRVFAREKELLADGVDLKAGAKELLAYLKENNYKIALATSSVPDRAINILKQHEIDCYFDAYVFGPEVEKGKPYPDVFLKACEKINERPEDCLVLEDSEAGIQAAYAAKIPVICVPDMKRPNQTYVEMTMRILKSLHEVIAVLQES